MTFQETEKVALKSIVQEDIKKEILAFANCNGGTVYVGVSNHGEILGLEDIDASTLQISNMVRDSIKPDITMFIHYEALEYEGKSIIAIHIQRGINRPYYLSKKGLRPEGVYVRQGHSAVPASDTAIRPRIKETDGDSFEEMRSINQELSFDALKQEFETRKIPFAQAQMQTLHIQSTDKLYTNLGLLLSDQCPYSIKVAEENFPVQLCDSFMMYMTISTSIIKSMQAFISYCVLTIETIRKWQSGKHFSTLLSIGITLSTLTPSSAFTAIIWSLSLWAGYSPAWNSMI